jgi:hypothetical protein
MNKDALIRFLVAINVVVLIVAAAPKKPQVLTVSEVDIVDAKGVVRARLGGDLPDSVVNGKVRHRGAKAAGLLLYDDTGQERGGYLTFSPGRQVALTLDSSKQQTALFVASSEGGAALKMSDSGQLLDFRVDPDDGPSIHAMQNKKVAFHAPPPVNFEKGAMCTELRGALKTMSRDDVLGFCRERTSEEACQACLGGQ